MAATLHYPSRQPAQNCHPEPDKTGGPSRARAEARTDREPRLSEAVTIAMCSPLLISEKSKCWGLIQVRPEAFGNQSCSLPPRTGTNQVSQPKAPSRAV